MDNLIRNPADYTATNIAKDNSHNAVALGSLAGFDLTHRLLADLITCAGQPISTIKLIRAYTGLGLKEAKDFYEELVKRFAEGQAARQKWNAPGSTTSEHIVSYWLDRDDDGDSRVRVVSCTSEADAHQQVERAIESGDTTYATISRVVSQWTVKRAATRVL